MSDSVRITNFPSDGSPHRVAFNLMEDIARYENDRTANPREYYLKLYRQCYRIVFHEKQVDVVLGGGE